MSDLAAGTDGLTATQPSLGLSKVALIDQRDLASLSSQERPDGVDESTPSGLGLSSLLRLAMPLVVSRAGLAAMTIADGWMVARSDAGQLALSSLADGTFGRVTDVFAAFVMSALPLVAAAAAGPSDARRAIWRRAAGAALLLGVVGIGIAALSPQILRLMVDDPDLGRGTAAVVWILGLGLPAGLVALASAMYLEATRRPVLVAAWVLAANGLNIALDWMLIGGHAGFVARGALGSALATTLVRIVLAAVLVLTLWRAEGTRLFFRSRGGGRGSAAAQWRFGASAAGTTAGFHALAIWLTIFAGWLGPQALAAFASCWLLTMPAMLLAVGIGDAIGLREAAGGRPAGLLRRDLTALAAILVPLGLLPALAPATITDLYTTDPVLRALIAGLLPISATVLLLDGLSYGIGAAMRARGDIIGSTTIQLGTMGATPVLAGAFAFGCHLGLRGLFLAALATSIGRLVLLLQRLRLRPDLRDRGSFGANVKRWITRSWPSCRSAVTSRASAPVEDNKS